VKLFSNQVSDDFPNADCRTRQITGVEQLAWCVSKDSSRCLHVLLYEKEHLCSHADCQAIAKRARLSKQ